MTELVHGTIEDPDDASVAAFEVETQIKTTIREMQRGWILLAGALFRFSEGKMWTALGYRTFEEWLASPDIEIKRRHVYGLLEVWRTFVVEAGVPPRHLEGVSISKLRDIMPAVRREQVSIEGALADARTLTRADLRDKYDPVPAHEPVDRPLDATTERALEQCEACGSWYSVRALADTQERTHG